MKSEFEEVFVTYDEVEAGMLVDLLRSGGIEAHMRSNKVTPFPVNVSRMGEIKIIVGAADEADARELIERECGLPEEGSDEFDDGSDTEGYGPDVDDEAGE